MKARLLILVAVLIVLVLSYAAVFSSDKDWCMLGKASMPCSWTPDSMEIKIHDAKEDKR